MTRAKTVLDAAKNMTKFFGCDLSKVSPINRLLALNGSPDWLRGRPKFTDLPRALPASREGMFRVKMPLISDREIAQRIYWIVENLEGNWSIDEKGFGFIIEAEALYFRLYWSG